MGGLYQHPLEFPCQPIDHYACHFRDRFRRVLYRGIVRQEIKQVDVVPALSWQVL